MRALFIIGLCLVVGVVIVDHAWGAIDSPVLLLLFGLGWIALLASGVFWLIQPRSCNICQCSWSIVDLKEFSVEDIKNRFNSCPDCRKNNRHMQ